jgi:hypothetical protein
MDAASGFSQILFTERPQEQSLYARDPSSPEQGGVGIPAPPLLPGLGMTVFRSVRLRAERPVGWLGKEENDE